MSKHRKDLREYFFNVARDMLARGLIRRQRGQLIEDVVRVEGEAVLSEVWADLKSVMAELGFTAVQGMKLMAQRKTGDMIDMGVTKLFDFLAGGHR